uniref:Uncharacterized protein n=1 Tax=Meloidogyne javanica TaxID=6303 RepID=A0A915LKY9_MELJA
MLKQAFGKLKLTTGKSVVLGITGSTCTGKTTLANELSQKLVNEGISTQVIHQDIFYKEKEEVITLTNLQDSSILFYNYDQIDSLKTEKMLEAVRKAKDLNQVVIVEGNMVTNLEEILKEIDAIILLTIDKKICEERRSKRIYDPPDEKGILPPLWQVPPRPSPPVLQRVSHHPDSVLQPVSFPYRQLAMARTRRWAHDILKFK